MSTTQSTPVAGESEATRLQKVQRNARRDERRQSRRGAWGDFALRVAFVALLIGLWHGAHYLTVTRPQDTSRGALFPAPSQVGT